MICCSIVIAAEFPMYDSSFIGKIMKLAHISEIAAVFKVKRKW